MLQAENFIEMDRMDGLKEECMEPEIMSELRPKQIEKKKLLTPTKMLIGFVGLFIFVLLSYKAYTLAFPSQTDSKLSQMHGKYIQTPESSTGRDSSSNGGSTYTKSSRDSSKPIGVAGTVGKDKISSNFNSAGGDGDEDPSERDNDGDRR